MVETHSMGEITKLLFQGDKIASLFDKSAMKTLILTTLRKNTAAHSRIHAEKIDKYVPTSLTLGHCKILSCIPISNFISLEELRYLRILIQLSLEPFHSSGWNSLGSKARKLERIRIDIAWEENWSRACPWAQVLGNLDHSLWKRLNTKQTVSTTDSTKDSATLTNIIAIAKRDGSGVDTTLTTVPKVKIDVRYVVPSASSTSY
ncbi:hypothetical protein IW262DRAFT_1298316 [Armillaria fumosa]|nr:hypothetical protein IW262DRAFT_1298316 [Armillaria fumosa]